MATAALLGVGRVGTAVLSLAQDDAVRGALTIRHALVRRAHGRDLPGAVRLTTSIDEIFNDPPDVFIEALGGIEPARPIVRRALTRGISVVTANKTLIAYAGGELVAAARTSGASLRYEASVLAGVPFLGTFAARPLVANVTALSGIVNGTTNYILTRMAADRVTFATALADAQQHGYAEPDPAKDIDGIDAGEKLCVLLRHFAGRSLAPSDLDIRGIDGITLGDIDDARRRGGVIRSIVDARWDRDGFTASVGPRFLADAHPFARIEGVVNAIRLETRYNGDLLFSGPGAGPIATAATLLDDAIEALREKVAYARA